MTEGSGHDQRVMTNEKSHVNSLILSPTSTRTLQDANVIGGDFRLTFGGYTTSTIAYDATASELGAALSDLPSVDSVDVSGLRVRKTATVSVTHD